MGHHDTGLEMGRRQHDRDRVDVGEEPQRDALVGHAVLGAQHADAGRRVWRQVRQGGRGVLALHGQDHHVAVAQVRLGRVAHRRGAQRGRAVGRHQREPVVPDGPQVVAPGHEGHVVPGLEQPPADRTADRTSAVHHESHVASLACRRGARRPWVVSAHMHLVDANVAMGNIEALVATQAEAYASGR